MVESMASQMNQHRRPRNFKVSLSKYMSLILRHEAAKKGIAIRADGHVLVDDLLADKQFVKWGCTLDTLKTVVDSNDKKRFELNEEDGKMYIRAVQGHSMKVV